MQVLGLVDIRQQAGEDAHAVQDFGRDRCFCGLPLGLQDMQAADDSIYEGLDILLRCAVSVGEWSVGWCVERQTAEVGG